jgi:CDGSH-type Zn-finger protein/uncharacterized Fe-S cluster protein YjdI
MPNKTYRDEVQDFSIEYDIKRCIHAAECVHGLPEVFDPERRPWIDPSRAPAEEIVKVVSACPSGALKAVAKGSDQLKPVFETNEILVAKDGPLFVKGDLRLKTSEGSVEETRVALCRCGASRNKPFCDNSHDEAGFEDAGQLGESSMGQEETESTLLEISSAPNGPLILKGPCLIRGSGDNETHAGVKGALCRCGQSENKPYCDGTHKPAGFEAD